MSTADRPRQTTVHGRPIDADGNPAMVTEPLDLDELLAEPAP